MQESGEAAGVVAEMCKVTSDPVLIDSMTAAAAAHAVPFIRVLGAWQRGTTNAEVQIAGRVAEHIARAKPDAAQLEIIIDNVNGVDGTVANAILDGLIAGLPSDFDFPTSAGFDAALLAAVKHMDSEARSKLIRLAARCGSMALEQHAHEVVEAMMSIVAKTDADDEDRAAAARELVGLRSNDARIVSLIVGQLGAQTTPELATQCCRRFSQAKHLVRANSLSKRCAR
jgi:hypothetical protein